MSREKIIHEVIGNSLEKNLGTKLNTKKEQEIVQGFIFSKIIQIINQKEKFILGPEKSKVAKFIAENYIEVYIFLDNLLNNNNLEGLD